MTGSSAAHFQPAVVLPDQLRGHGGFVLPEQRLALAVLEDAVSCLQRYARAGSRRERRLYAEARAWLLDDHDPSPFSCTNVCAAVGIDVEYLRRGLDAWVARTLAGVVSEPYRARRNGGSRTRATTYAVARRRRRRRTLRPDYERLQNETQERSMTMPTPC